MKTNADNWLVSRINNLRGFFAIGVLLDHAITVAIPSVNFCNNKILLIFKGAFLDGGLWVSGFFFISGFCIHRTIEKSISDGSFNLKTYFLHRTTRIFPLFWLGLLIALLVELITFMLNSRIPLFNQGINMRCFFMSIPGLQAFFEPYGCYLASWSITYELIYYIFWGYVAFIHRGFSKKTFLISYATFFIVTVSCYLFWKNNKVPVLDNILIRFWLIPWSGLVWLNGALMCHIWENINKSEIFIKISTIAAFPLLLLALLIDGYISTKSHSLLYKQISYPIYMIMFPTFLLLYPINKLRINSDFLGNISYPLYLLHIPCIVLLAAVFIFYPVSIYIQIIAYILVPLALVIFMGIPIEKWILKWRVSFLKSYANTL